jgi:hypothetical protein
MRNWFAIVSLVTLFASPATLKGDLWVGGHGDIGIGLVGNTLDLHLHFEDAVDKGGGGSIPAGEYGPGDHTIFVPGPTVDRPAGSQWDFLGAPTDKIWFLPASSDPNKPYLGWATEELSPGDFNGNITVRLTSIVSAPREGLYDIEFTAFANHKTLGDISGTGVFKFAVGVPEPSSIALLAMASSGGVFGWLRRKKNARTTE